MNTIPAGVSPAEIPSLGVKVLAVLGGAALLGWLAGWIANKLTRLTTTKPMPPWGLRCMRALGAVLGGYLVFIFVFGGGGGVGGGGGFGFGQGKDHGRTGDKPPPEEKKDKDPPPEQKDKPKPGPVGDPLLKVTVLDEDVLKDLTGSDKPNRERRYRIEGESTKDLKTLDELRAELLSRKKKTPKLKVEVVLYQDSAPEFSQEVKRLVEDFLVREDMFKAWDRPARLAPR